LRLGADLSRLKVGQPDILTETADLLKPPKSTSLGDLGKVLGNKLAREDAVGSQALTQIQSLLTENQSLAVRESALTSQVDALGKEQGQLQQIIDRQGKPMAMAESKK